MVEADEGVKGEARTQNAYGLACSTTVNSEQRTVTGSCGVAPTRAGGGVESSRGATGVLH